MKRVVLLLLCYEFADIMTTIIGIERGLTEQNLLFLKIGMTQFLCLKIVLTIIAALILQFKKPYKIDIIIPIIAGLPVVWNVFSIFFET